MVEMGQEAIAERVAGEIRQRDEEGFDVSAIREDYPDPAGLSQADLEVVYEKLTQVEMRADFPYVEPSDWDGIVASATGPLVDMDTDLVDGDLFDRLHGAWLGRCVGYMLGKPCEMLTREQIAVWLKEADAYPLADYFIDLAVTSDTPSWLAERLSLLHGPAGRDELLDWRPDTLRGLISRAVRNRNIDYPIARLGFVETFGLNFTAFDIAESLISGGFVPQGTTACDNPNRETIAATMQADVWAFVLPGRPGNATELAFRDASCTHTKNGIYGELLAAAMISAAFSTSDVDEVVRIGLQAIPEQSRLAEAVGSVIEWHAEHESWERTWAEVARVYGHYDSTHTIPNVCWIVLGLLYGEGDFEKSVTTTVMCGMDTDSTAATVGSVLGTMYESHGIPEKFNAPLNDRVESSVAGTGSVRISELARRTLDVVRELGTNL